MTAPGSSEAPAVAAAQRFQVQEQNEPGDFQSNGCADQAALTIEGESYALAYLDRLNAGTTTPDDLAVLMAFLHDEMLHGACRAIEKALKSGRHA